MDSVIVSTDAVRVPKRTGNACDACRSRKVKCAFEQGQQICNACKDIGVDCTTARPCKRRGPPNKYVEEQRRKVGRLFEQPRPSPPILSAPLGIDRSPSFLSTAYTLEDFAPILTIKQAIDDWFDCIHPIAPVLHRDTFLKQFADPERRTDVDFICLTISICAAVVTSLRMKTAEYATSIMDVYQCDQIIQSLDQYRPCPPLSLPRCLTKYNLAIAYATHGMDRAEPQLRMAEAMAMTGYAVHYNIRNFSICDRELLKRLYWLCFCANCTLGLHGRPFMMPSMARTSTDALIPQNINDNDLCDIRMDDGDWHGHNTSYIPGLNALIDLFRLWAESQQGDTSNHAYLQLQIDKVSTSLDHIPPELRWRGGLSRPMRSNAGTDAQMVNLYITQIQIRSFLLEQMYHAAHQSQSPDVLKKTVESRQSLVDDMLTIVYQMPEDTLEANGHSLVDKLRSIGLALLDDNDSDVSFVNLDRLLAKLDRLDAQPGVSANSTSPHTGLITPNIDV